MCDLTRPHLPGIGLVVTAMAPSSEFDAMSSGRFRVNRATTKLTPGGGTAKQIKAGLPGLAEPEEPARMQSKDWLHTSVAPVHRGAVDLPCAARLLAIAVYRTIGVLVCCPTAMYTNPK
jgi:hypothetical protein